ncbi:hypothetical protein AGMMS50256_07160 [Betaproteobacteria bacterium]|nr:hypothetical protein AGMMS50256_07160 [Betaproteobacteria bacterium]
MAGEPLQEVVYLDNIAEVGHWLTHDDHEVDLVIEHGDGTVVAFKIKIGTGIQQACQTQKTGRVAA